MSCSIRSKKKKQNKTKKQKTTKKKTKNLIKMIMEALTVMMT